VIDQKKKATFRGGFFRSEIGTDCGGYVQLAEISSFLLKLPTKNKI